jgi:hypothetical protein
VFIPHRVGCNEAEFGEFVFDLFEVCRDFDSWNSPDMNLMEGNMREQLEKQQEMVKGSIISFKTTQYSSEKSGEDEDLMRNVLEGEKIQHSGPGDEIEVEQKSNIVRIGLYYVKIWESKNGKLKIILVEEK